MRIIINYAVWDCLLQQILIIIIIFEFFLNNWNWYNFIVLGDLEFLNEQKYSLSQLRELFLGFWSFIGRKNCLF